MNQPTYKYDVAVSFTEAQRDIAVGIRLALEAMNISCYYYCYDAEENLGKDLTESLTYVYGSSCLIAIAIISEEYLKKHYSQVEFDVICERLSNEPDFFIPVRIGEVMIPDQIKHLTHFWWGKDPKAIAKLVHERLQKKSAQLLSTDVRVISNLSKYEITQTIERYAIMDSKSAEFHFGLGLHYFYLNLSAEDLRKSATHFRKAFEIRSSYHEALFYYSKACINAIGINQIKFHEIKEPMEYLTRAIQLKRSPPYLLWIQELDQRFFSRHGLRNPLKHHLQ